jgi:hypothetical protein
MGVHRDEVADHSIVFADERMGGRELDLHTSFPGIGVSSEDAWATLWGKRQADFVAGVPAFFPNMASRALLTLLHSARDGERSPRAVEDVRRCVTRLDPDLAAEMLDLAAALGAVAGLHAGLVLTAEGRAWAERLGIDGPLEPQWALRSASASPLAVRLVQLRQASWPRRLVLLWREVFPSAAFLRATRPDAGAGIVGLLRAYVGRIVAVIREFPSAWTQARKAMERPARRP